MTHVSLLHFTFFSYSWCPLREWQGANSTVRKPVNIIRCPLQSREQHLSPHERRQEYCFICKMVGGEGLENKKPQRDSMDLIPT